MYFYFIFFVSGINSPDFALYESSKLLTSLMVTVVGKNLYGSSSIAEARFIDQGATFTTLTLSAVASMVLFICNTNVVVTVLIPSPCL